MQQLSKKMTDKIILIAGGTTPVGKGLVHFFLQAGATVIVPAKSLDEITKLKASVADINSDKLITQLTELPDYDTGFDIAETIVEKFGRIDIGIAFFNGSPCNRQLTEVGINDWQNMVDNEITPFFVSARLILNTMKANKDGLYISLCDASSADQHKFPPLSKIAANVKMDMSKMFAEETKKYNVRYYHLGIKHTGKPKEITEGHQDMPVITSEMIGSQIIKLYLGETDKPDEILQLITEKNII